MHVRMAGHRRSPGVEHGGDADARAEMLRIGGNRQHRLRRCLEQQVVDERLVVEGDVGADTGPSPYATQKARAAAPSQA